MLFSTQKCRFPIHSDPCFFSKPTSVPEKPCFLPTFPDINSFHLQFLLDFSTHPAFWFLAPAGADFAIWSIKERTFSNNLGWISGSTEFVRSPQNPTTLGFFQPWCLQKHSSNLGTEAVCVCVPFPPLMVEHLPHAGAIPAAFWDETKTGSLEGDPKNSPELWPQNTPKIISRLEVLKKFCSKIPYRILLDFGGNSWDLIQGYRNVEMLPWLPGTEPLVNHHPLPSQLSHGGTPAFPFLATAGQRAPKSQHGLGDGHISYFTNQPKKTSSKIAAQNVKKKYLLGFLFHHLAAKDFHLQSFLSSGSEWTTSSGEKLSFINGALQLFSAESPMSVCSKQETSWVFPKIVGFPPKSSILIGFSIIFTIHFGGPPLFLETPSWWLNQSFEKICSPSNWTIFPGSGWLRAHHLGNLWTTWEIISSTTSPALGLRVLSEIPGLLNKKIHWINESPKIWSRSVPKKQSGEHVMTCPWPLYSQNRPFSITHRGISKPILPNLFLCDLPYQTLTHLSESDPQFPGSPRTNMRAPVRISSVPGLEQRRYFAPQHCWIDSETRRSQLSHLMMLEVKLSFYGIW